MRSFTFSLPTKVIFGQGRVGELAAELRAANINRVLLLTGGRSVFASGLYERITKMLNEAGVVWETVSGVQPNPRLGKVREAILAAREMQAQAIVPIGGGSVFDSAKAVAAGFYADKDIWVVITRKLAVERALPIYGVLTISGTSSEVNGISVINNEETHEKFLLASPLLVPAVAIIDPTLQYTVPRQMVLSAGMDALSHVLEAYCEGLDTSEIIIENSETLMRGIIRCLRALAADESKFEDYGVRSELAFCSVYAHSGWSSVGRAVRGDFSSHPIAHSLGALYDVTHGVAMGIVMPAWMRYIYEQGLAQDVFVRLATHVFELTEADSNDLVTAGAAALKNLVHSVGLPTTLGEVRITADDIPALAETASRTLPFGSVKRMDLEGITQVFKNAL